MGITNVTANGNAVKRITLGGGLLWENGKYEVLEYLESDGEAYIDTEYTFDPTDEMTAIVAMLESLDVTDKYFVSPSTFNTGNSRFALGGFSGRVFICAAGASPTGTTSYKPRRTGDSDVHTYSYKEKVFQMEDTGMTYTASSKFWPNPTNLLLFWGSASPTKCQIYGYTHTKDGALVRDLIPARRLTDGEVGMYDRVTKQFFTNQGTGAFTPGAATGERL